MTTQKDRKTNWKAIIWIILLILIITSAIYFFPKINSWFEENERLGQERIDYSNNWSKDFCIENGYEDYYDSNTWDHDYCKQGNLFIKFRKEWNYTGRGFKMKRDKIVGAMFVPS